MAKTKKRVWSLAEDAYLKENYGKLAEPQLAANLNVKLKDLVIRVGELNLVATPPEKKKTVNLGGFDRMRDSISMTAASSREADEENKPDNKKLFETRYRNDIHTFTDQ